jgi:phosphatidylserine/phosphatidylglycerophosphate/cardiolipin synthase-like enzyme
MAAPLLSIDSAVAADRRKPLSVTRAAPPENLMRGDAVRVAGTVKPTRAGAPVLLQRSRGRQWVTVKRARVARNQRYAFRFRPSAGRQHYRVLAPGNRHRRTGASRPFALNAQTCNRMPRPRQLNTVWFTNPDLRGTSPITKRLSSLFCAAAPGATVNIAMYYVRAGDRGSDVRPILTALQRMVRFRDLTVRFILEGKLYRRGSPLRSTLKELRAFGTVIRCDWGCRSRKPTPAQGGSHSGIQHHKFITVSDMSWTRRVDPVVVSSSANWSHSQLHNRWQSAVMSYGDQELAREFSVQTNLLRVCAGRGGCAAWSSHLDKLGLAPEEHGVEMFNQVWHDAQEQSAERSGDVGRGSGVIFSPWRGADRLAEALGEYTCGTDGSVRVAHMFITRARTPVLNALDALQSQGCDVRVILTSTTNSTSQQGIQLARERGLNVTCAEGMHDKVILVDAYRASDGARERVLWTGSQSLGGNALRANEEAMLRLSVFEAEGAAANANASVFARFGTHWRAMRRQPTGCVSPTSVGTSS